MVEPIRCWLSTLGATMKRREFIGLVGGAATWPVVALAQQPEPMRRIGVLVGLAENDPEMKERLAGFRQGLEKLGWSEGSNVRIDYRFAPGGTQVHLLAIELVALQPDVILAQSTPATAALKPETSTIPIVFAGIADPIGSVSLQACRDPAAISPACCNTKRVSPANGWLCSRRLHRTSRALLFWPIQERRLSITSCGLPKR